MAGSGPSPCLVTGVTTPASLGCGPRGGALLPAGEPRPWRRACVQGAGAGFLSGPVLHSDNTGWGVRRVIASV